MYPLVALVIHKLMVGHIIIGIYIRQVIVFCMIIAYRPPIWLAANVKA